MANSIASGMNTLSVPVINTPDAGGTGRNPAVLYRASAPTRLLVRNVSSLGLLVLLSYDNPSDSTGATNTPNTYQLPAGMSDVFVLQKGETLYASTPSANPALVSIAWSAAFPFDVVKP